METEDEIVNWVPARDDDDDDTWVASPAPPGQCVPSH